MGNSRRFRRQRHHGRPPVSRVRVWAIMLSTLAVLMGTGAALFNLHAPGGEVFPHGYWLGGKGVENASRVVPAERFGDPRVRTTYRIARRIPEVLNQVYCWCGCMEEGMRSALECFESDHAADCEVCLRTAELAWEMVQQGEPHPEAIHEAIDEQMRPN